MRRLLPLFGLLTVATPAVAQEPADTRSPYVGEQTRAIKALSDEDVRALREGEGMGYALAAELNGWPGPRHVLDLADALDLDADQRARVESIHGRMNAAARAIGAKLVEAERQLDGAFASDSVEPAVVRETTAEIARLAGELRAVHLLAHVETRAALTPAQVERYLAIRGYGGPADGGHDHAGGTHEGGT